MAETWRRATLDAACLNITDGSHYSPQTSTTGFPYVTVRNLGSRGIDFESCEGVDERSFLELQRAGCSPEPGDVLFSKDGTVGKVAVNDSDRKFVVLSSLAILRPNKQLLGPAFLGLVLSSEAFQHAATQEKTGLAIKRVVLKNLRAMEIPVPPLPVQRRIVDLVGALDTQIEVLTSEATAIGQYRVSLREALMSSDASWQDSSWSEVVTRTTGISYASGDLASHGEGLPFINLKSIGRGGGYRPEGLKWYRGAYKNSQVVRAGELLIANTDLTRDKAILGCPAIVPNLPDFGRACISLDVSRVVPDPTRLLTGFLYEFLQLASSRDFMKTHSSGTTVMHLKTKELVDLRVRYPGLADQQEIAVTLGRIEDLSAALSHEEDRLHAIRGCLATALLGRDIEIPESYDTLLAV